MTNSIKVAISSDFFTAFARLPKAQQSKVGRFITNFQKNPKSPGINYERVRQARDPQMHSVRIDQDYRAIVLAPERSDVYMVLWVDRHDDAYDWAVRHECAINSETGALQIYEPARHADELTATQPSSPEGTGVYAALKDRNLIRMGVPEAMIEEVRRVVAEEDLDRLANRLPAEAYEALFLYLAGSRYEDIINERELAEAQVDTEDFAAALERVDTQSRFVVVENELELEKMLNAPLAKWRVFLHPSQRNLVARNWNGPVRVLGGAGTGKTVVAMHRAKWLVENFLQGENEKVLFTTFTRNLAIDIENNLKAICDPEVMSHIEVVNLDRWVNNLLRRKKYEFQILYGSDSEQFWQKALDLAPADLGLADAFYREEWQKVIQPQNITTSEAYIRASRLGRGTTLRRADRKRIWPVFEEYRNLLNEHQRREVDDAYRDAADLLAHEPHHFGYRVVIVDEAQDMSTQAFRLIRQIVPEGPNDLFIVGDGHQRIYNRNKVVLSHCGIQIRGRSRKLRINYRTTEENRHWAIALLEGHKIDDLEGGVDDNKDYKSLTHGPEPVIKHFEDFGAQLAYIDAYLGHVCENGEDLRSTCIVARTTAECSAIQAGLSDRGISILKLGKDTRDDDDQPGVRLATMHRIKGLEFDRIILASVNDGLIPLQQALADKGDRVEVRQADLEERALLYVAVTRGKKEVAILSYGIASPYLQ